MRTSLQSLVAASLCAFPLLAANPITNGSFENLSPGGTAPGWEFMGNVTVRTEHVAAGKRALRLLREPDVGGETGLNRAWTLRSGTQGSMLAERKGAIRFRYLAVTQEKPGALSVQIIPMTKQTLEAGGKRTIWRVPTSDVGDGKWHQGEFAYDYSQDDKVAWVHVSSRLHAVGELWLDDFQWVPEVDAVPQFASVDFVEEPGQEGQAGAIEATIRNLGSKPMPASTISLELPQGLTGPTEPIATPSLPPNESASVRIPVLGLRDKPAYEFKLALAAGKKEAAAEILLASQTELDSLRCEGLVVEPGKPTRVELLARNTGHTMVASVPTKLIVPEGVAVEPIPLASPLAPGLVAPVAAWQITVPAPSPLVRLRAVTAAEESSVETHLLAAHIGKPPRTATGHPSVTVKDDWRVIADKKVRLALFPTGSGSWGGLLQVRQGWHWQTVATLPRIGLLRTPAGEAALAFTKTTYRVDNGKAVLRLEGETTVDDASWQAACELTLASGADSIDYRLEATPQGNGQYLAIEGPMLYAGAGLPERDDAILPGLEWLVRGEESSNALDIKPDHPDCVRYVPHPIKITVPAAGMRFGDIAVGLHWPAPPAQDSVAIAGAQSLVFASPDRFEGHDSHLIGLMLPGVCRGLPENGRALEEPLDASEQTLVIAASLVAATDAPDSLVVLDRWYSTHGFPKPLAFPRGDALGELAFSMQAYAKDKALWNPEWGKWYSDIIVGFRPTLDPLYELLVTANLLGSRPEAAPIRKLALDVAGKPLAEAEHCLHHGDTADGIRDLVKKARTTVSQQQPDGNWVFTGSKASDDWPEGGVDYSKLGPKGAREVGFTAAPARQVLDAALLSGDPELRAAGLKALDAMRAFRVPRAAQVWEVPAHTPDILASARAVDAYLAGYRLTGDRQYIEDAVYWARTGLPFVYVWHPADQPLVQGTSIPVFGATSYVLSWFAVAVQWNGLCYSQSLYDLAPYDDSFPWTRVADNILVSGMYQQATEGDRLGQWPDAVNLLVPRRGLHGQTPPCFRPSTIVNQTLLGLGISRTSRNYPLRQGRKQLVLRTSAQVEQAVWEQHRVSFTARYVPPVSGTVALLGTARPTEVTINGETVAEDKGWQWLEKEAMLLLDLPKPGEYKIAIEGVSPQTGQWLSPVTHEINFVFTDSILGWSPSHALAPFAIADKVLTTAATGEDPYMGRDALLVPGHAGDVLEVELAISDKGTPHSVEVFWATTSSPGYAASRSLRASVAGDGEWHTVRIPIGQDHEWQDQTITNLRIDPGTGGKNIPTRIRSIRCVAAE